MTGATPFRSTLAQWTPCPRLVARFRPGEGFFSAPFPDPLRQRDDGRLAARDLPNPTGNNPLSCA